MHPTYVITLFLFPRTCKTDVMRVWPSCGGIHNQGISGHYLIATVTLLPTSQARLTVTRINPVWRPSLRDSIFDGCKCRNEFPRLIAVDWITGTVYIQLCYWACSVNPLNAELNPVCHLLILLEDLTFMAYATHSTLKPVPTLPR
jgi:hypothetical protein